MAEERKLENENERVNMVSTPLKVAANVVELRRWRGIAFGKGPKWSVYSCSKALDGQVSLSSSIH